MSVLIRDAVEGFSPKSREMHESGGLSVLLYADDTLLMGASQTSMQELLDVIARTGLRYGMELHWQKFQLLQVNRQVKLRTPSGEDITARKLMTYLGTTIYSDGKVANELNQKLGAARAEFQKLRKLWNHSSLSKTRKLQIYQAVVVSRLLYGLSSAWLNAVETRRLNGFQARCLRCIVNRFKFMLIHVNLN